MSQKVVVGVVFVAAMFMSIIDANAVCFNASGQLSPRLFKLAGG